MSFPGARLCGWCRKLRSVRGRWRCLTSPTGCYTFFYLIVWKILIRLASRGTTVKNIKRHLFASVFTFSDLSH